MSHHPLLEGLSSTHLNKSKKTKHQRVKNEGLQSVRSGQLFLFFKSVKIELKEQVGLDTVTQHSGKI
jgi:hypothetical protein